MDLLSQRKKGRVAGEAQLFLDTNTRRLPRRSRFSKGGHHRLQRYVRAGSIKGDAEPPSPIWSREVLALDIAFYRTRQKVNS